MIDITKSYKTGDGRDVKLGFPDGDVVHGWVFSPQGPNDSPVPGRNWINWLPACWDMTTGFSISKAPGADATDKDFAFRLEETLPTKVISHTFFVQENGVCVSKQDDATLYFAEITVNMKVEEGQKRVLDIRDIPTGEKNMSLNAKEFKALHALTVYGTTKFLNYFYDHLGKSYLEPYERGLISLFEKVRKIKPEMEKQ